MPLNAVRTRNIGPADVEEAFQCANQECGSLFIGHYAAVPGRGEYYVFERATPMVPHAPPIKEEVASVSPTFVEIYSQALAAEGFGLTQLTGIGLRKALEFLIKDFAVNQHPTERDSILTKTLATCINEYLTDPNLQATARRAAWLGNDETHYLRKWEEKDISDLRVLIRLTMNWVDTVILTARYIADMPS
jgi:hypothetical protein